MFGTNYVIRSLLCDYFGGKFSVQTLPDLTSIKVEWHEGPTVHAVAKCLRKFDNHKLYFVRHTVELADNS